MITSRVGQKISPPSRFPRLGLLPFRVWQTRIHRFNDCFVIFVKYLTIIISCFRLLSFALLTLAGLSKDRAFPNRQMVDESVHL